MNDDHATADAPQIFELVLDETTVAQLVTQLTDRYCALEETTHFLRAMERDCTRSNLELRVHQIEGHNASPAPGGLLDTVLGDAVERCLARPEPQPVQVPHDSPLLAVARLGDDPDHDAVVAALSPYTKRQLADALVDHGGYNDRGRYTNAYAKTRLAREDRAELALLCRLVTG